MSRQTYPISPADHTPPEIRDLFQALGVMERCDPGSIAGFEARGPLSDAIHAVERDSEPFVFYRQVILKAKEVLAQAMKDKASQKAWSANERVKMIQAFDLRQAEEREQFLRDLDRMDAFQVTLEQRFSR